MSAGGAAGVPRVVVTLQPGADAMAQVRCAQDAALGSGAPWSVHYAPPMAAELAPALEAARRLGATVEPLPAASIVPAGTPPRRPGTAAAEGGAQTWRLWAEGAAVFVLCTAVGEVVWRYFDPANLLLLYFSGVVFMALRHGRAAALAFVLASVAVFDLMFVAPRWSMHPIEPQYFFTFAVMLAVGWLVSGLAARARDQALTARARARRTQVLNDLAAALAVAQQDAEVAQAVCATVAQQLGAEAALLVPGPEGGLLRAGGAPSLADPAAAATALAEHCETGLGAAHHPAAAARHLPLLAGGAALGVLAVAPLAAAHDLAEDQRLLRALASQAATALDRARLQRLGRAADVAAESERLRNTLLAGVSHDFRTPLTTIIGSATSLLDQGATLDASDREALLRGLLAQARRMHRTMSDLLELTRLEEPGVQPAPEWCPADELVAAVLVGMGDRLARHQVQVDVPSDAVLWCDARLMEQLLLNLLDNAARHTPAGGAIAVQAGLQPGQAWLQVHDGGPGFPPGSEQAMLGKFVRGRKEAAGGGTGLGLALCAAVARLHGGRLQLHSQGGACVRLQWPQPPLPADAAGAQPGAGA